MTLEPATPLVIRASLLILLAGFGLVACEGGAPPADGWAGSVDTLANGVLVVSNPSQGLWESGVGSESTPSGPWRLVEDLRIGSVDGEDLEAFGEVRDLVVDDRGRIHVLDGLAVEIRSFDTDGSALGVMGGEGQGPGELSRPGGMALDPSGDIWVLDGGNTRYSVFDPDEGFQTVHPRPGIAGSLRWRGAFTTDGRLLDPTALTTGGTGLVQLNSALEPRDTLALEPFEPARGFVEDEARAGVRWPIPFQPEFAWSPDPSGRLWWGVNDRFRFVEGTLGGDTLRVIERETDPTPVTAEEIRDLLGAMRAANRDADQVPLRAEHFPDTKPAWSSLIPDDEGHLWVAPYDFRERPTDRFHIFDPDGRYLGEVRSETPVVPYPIKFREGHLYGVTRDEFDVPYVVRLRIEGR